MNISIGGVTAIDSNYGSKIYCAWSSIIHIKGHKIWSDFNEAF